MEIHFDQKTIVLDNYINLKGFGVNVKNLRSEIPDKGLLEELVALHDYLSGNTQNVPIRIEDLFQTTEATFIIDAIN